MVPEPVVRATQKLEGLLAQGGASPPVTAALWRAFGRLRIVAEGGGRDAELAALRAASRGLAESVAAIEASPLAADREVAEATRKIQRSIDRLLRPTAPKPASPRAAGPGAVGPAPPPPSPKIETLLMFDERPPPAPAPRGPEPRRAASLRRPLPRASGSCPMPSFPLHLRLGRPATSRAAAGRRARGRPRRPDRRSRVGRPRARRWPTPSPRRGSSSRRGSWPGSQATTIGGRVCL